MTLYKYFSNEELNCKCNECGPTWHKMDFDFMQKLIALREKVGALQLTSAYRCPDYNSKVSSTGMFGAHTTGKAVDILCRGQQALVILKAALDLGFTGIGVNQKGEGRFIHVDTCSKEDHLPRPAMWSY